MPKAGWVFGLGRAYIFLALDALWDCYKEVFLANDSVLIIDNAFFYDETVVLGNEFVLLGLKLLWLGFRDVKFVVCLIKTGIWFGLLLCPAVWYWVKFFDWYWRLVPRSWVIRGKYKMFNCAY